MKKIEHKRTIQIVDFELPRGEVHIDDLMAMPRETWEHLRTEITLRWSANRDRPLARCRLCEKAVFIRAQSDQKGGHIPMFVHSPTEEKEDEEVCPWHEGGHLHPDDARAAQYSGHQESARHRQLCRFVEALAKQDVRCRASSVESYLRPSISERGRYPDVYLDMGELGRFAIEIQLSKPFAREIAGRHLSYEREKMRLVWLFEDIQEPLPQGFHDVITMQRGNAFIFDAAAREASIERGTLAFKVLLEDGSGGWQPFRLITLDDLQISTGTAFVEDCRSLRLLEKCKEGRFIWLNNHETARRTGGKNDEVLESVCFEPVWRNILTHTPSLERWSDTLTLDTHGYKDGRVHCIKTSAILFSIIQTIRGRRSILYLSAYKGEGALIAMLNSKLGSAEFCPYANLIKAFISRTALVQILERPSLVRAISKAQVSSVQADAKHPVWMAMAYLFPEILNPIIRTELEEMNSLPAWANSICSSGEHFY